MIHLATATFARGPYGTFSLDVYEGDGSPDITGSPASVRLTSRPVMRWGDGADLSYGSLVLPGYLEATFLNRPAELDGDASALLGIFATDASSRVYLARVSGTGDDGEAWTWWGRVQHGATGRPLGRTTPDYLPVQIRDIGFAGSIAGQSAVGLFRTSDVIAYGLTEVLPHLDVLLYYDLHGSNQDDNADRPGGPYYSPLDVAVLEELAGDPQRRDYGSVKDQLERLASALGLRIYQATDGTWRAEHRAVVGEARSTTFRMYRPTPFVSTTLALDEQALGIAAHSKTVTDGDGMEPGTDEIDRLSPARQIVVTSETGDLVRNGRFRYKDDGGDPVGWALGTETVGNTSFYNSDYEYALEDNTWVEQSLDVLPAEQGVFLRVDIVWSKIIGINENAGIDVRLSLEPSDGTATQYLSSDGTWTTTLTLAASPRNSENLSSIFDLAIEAAEALPLTGEVTLRIQGATADSSHTVPALRDVAAYQADATGEVIRNISYGLAGTTVGVEVKLKRPPLLQVKQASQAYTLAQSWVSERWGVTSRDLAEAAATDRLAQQSEAVPVLVAALRGLHPPERALVHDGERYVAGALEVDFERGVTHGVWVRLPSDAGGGAAAGTVKTTKELS